METLSVILAISLLAIVGWFGVSAARERDRWREYVKEAEEEEKKMVEDARTNYQLVLEKWRKKNAINADLDDRKDFEKDRSAW